MIENEPSRIPMLYSHIDQVTRRDISGWAVDANDPTRPVQLSISVGGHEQGRVCADLFRSDLRDLGTYGDGCHGFAYKFDSPLPPARDHDVMVRFVKTGDVVTKGQFRIEKETAPGADPIIPTSVRYGVAYGWASAPPRFIIHVGPHKTGSTYLQYSLGRLAGRLAEQGVLYPTCWCPAPGNPIHTLLPRRLRAGRDPNLAEDFRRLTEAGHRTVVISSEDISDLEEPALDAFRSLIGDHPAEIVFYCRRWSELIPSGWQEKVKQGHAMTFPDFVQLQIRQAVSAPNTNFGRKLDLFASYFGRENIKLVSYNNLVDDGIDIFGHFMQAVLGLEADELPIRERLNQSVSMFDIEMIRVLNAFDSARNGSASPEIFSAYFDLKPTLDMADITAVMERNVLSLVLDDNATPFLEMHQGLFEKYSDLLMTAGPAGCLFKPRSRDCRYVGPDYLVAAGVIEKLRHIHAKIEQICALA